MQIRAEFARAAASGLLLSGWMVLLFSGVALGGAVHVLLLASLAAFPWKQIRGGG